MEIPLDSCSGSLSNLILLANASAHISKVRRKNYQSFPLTETQLLALSSLIFAEAVAPMLLILVTDLRKQGIGGGFVPTPTKAKRNLILFYIQGTYI